jgi:hypothetical protein
MPLPRSQQDILQPKKTAAITTEHSDAIAPAVQTERNKAHNPNEKIAGSGTYCHVLTHRIHSRHHLQNRRKGRRAT